MAVHDQEWKQRPEEGEPSAGLTLGFGAHGVEEGRPELAEWMHRWPGSLDDLQLGFRRDLVQAVPVGALALGGAVAAVLGVLPQLAGIRAVVLWRTASFTWLMVFGLMGAFQRLFRVERPAIRYVSDSSYWLYLTHDYYVMGLQIALASLALVSFVKYAIVVSVTLACLFVTYEFGVRYTWIGAVLNGRKTRSPVPHPVRVERGSSEPRVRYAVSMQDTFTILDGVRECGLDARVDGDHVLLGADSLHEQLGWELKPEGLCKERVCVLVRDRAALVRDHGLDLASLAALLNRPLVVNVEERCAALGTDHLSRAKSLATLEAPDFELPDVTGTLHRLSDQRGKKVLLIAYASW